MLSLLRNQYLKMKLPLKFFVFFFQLYSAVENEMYMNVFKLIAIAVSFQYEMPHLGASYAVFSLYNS